MATTWPGNPYWITALLTMAVAMDELIETRQRPKVSGGRTRDYSDKDRRMVKNWLEGSRLHDGELIPSSG